MDGPLSSASSAIPRTTPPGVGWGLFQRFGHTKLTGPRRIAQPSSCPGLAASDEESGTTNQATTPTRAARRATPTITRPRRRTAPLDFAPPDPTPSKPTPTPSEPTPSKPAPSEPTPSEPTPSDRRASEPSPSEPVPSCVVSLRGAARSRMTRPSGETRGGVRGERPRTGRERADGPERQRTRGHPRVDQRPGRRDRRTPRRGVAAAPPREQATAQGSGTERGPRPGRRKPGMASPRRTPGCLRALAADAATPIGRPETGT